MSAYAERQEFKDLAWFNVNAVTLIAGLPVKIRGAGRFSLCVVNAQALELAIPNPAEIERVRSILADVFDDAVARLDVTHKGQVPALKGTMEADLRRLAAPKFEALGLQLTQFTLEQWMPT
jgi:hypothetical protein